MNEKIINGLGMICLLFLYGCGIEEWNKEVANEKEVSCQNYCRDLGGEVLRFTACQMNFKANDCSCIPNNWDICQCNINGRIETIYAKEGRKWS